MQGNDCIWDLLWFINRKLQMLGATPELKGHAAVFAYKSIGNNKDPMFFVSTVPTVLKSITSTLDEQS